jgi:small subunit ribosomal protein S27Ae
MTEKTGKPGVAKKPEKPEKTEKPEKPEVAEKKPEIAEKPEKPEKPKAKAKKKKKIFSNYKIEGGKLERLLPFCERCGQGYFMADHGNRYTCGQCGFTRYKTNK